MGIYTRGLFATQNEEENRQVTVTSTDEDLDLVGIVINGKNKKVDKAVDKLKFHS